MKARALIVAVLGLALAIYLLMYVGWGSVFSAAVAVGWNELGPSLEYDQAE